MAYGGGLAVVLTVNDPVSLSDVPEAQHGQAAGVSATAERFGGALGIALLYLVFHTTYVAQLHAISITRHLASGNFTLVSCISCLTNITMAIYGPPYSQLQQKSLHGTASIS